MGVLVENEWPVVAVPFDLQFRESIGVGQRAQVSVRTEDRNPLHDLPLSRANAPGSLLCSTTKLSTADEDLRPSPRR